MQLDHRFLALVGVLVTAPSSCSREEPPPNASKKGLVDAHVHLTDMDAVPALLATLRKKGIEQAAILSTPDSTAGRGGKGLTGYRRGNDVVLEAAKAHPGTLVPFVTLDLAHDDPAYLEDLLARGACGVKLYDGHHGFHEEPLDAPSHGPIFAKMEQLGIPVLLHVNTVRFRSELEGVLRAFPKLSMVCPHLCGSRTDLDRFESLRDEFPNLLFDVSHGNAEAASQGFAYLEKESARFRRILEKTPERFLFGSDLVTIRQGPTWQDEWDMQVGANLGLLQSERFVFWRASTEGRSLSPGTYRGQALPPALLEKILSENARRWLSKCLR